MSDYNFERLNESNLKDLLFLYKQAFNEIESLSFLQKKYDTSYVGIKYVGYIAYSSKTQFPAAYYGVFPVNLEYNEQIILAAQSGDTMTHPDHRGKGLFIKLAKMTYELAKELNIEFVFGFPNDNSYPGFIRKLEWRHYSNVNYYKIKASSIPLDKLAKRFKFLKPIHDTLLPAMSKIEISKQFSNSLHKQNPEFGCVYHDSNFFTYKTYYSCFVIELNGIKCWIKIDGRLWVGDIEFCEENKFNEVVDSLVKYARKKLCASVLFSFFENSLYDQWLNKRFKANSKIAVGCLNLSMNYDPEKFAYQGADFDTF